LVTPLDQARAELAAIGITLGTAPGEFLIYRKGFPHAAQVAETLAEAVELGRALAANAPKKLPPTGPLGKRSRRGDTIRHNRRLN
jgi:hypothetical protein